MTMRIAYISMNLVFGMQYLLLLEGHTLNVAVLNEDNKDDDPEKWFWDKKRDWSGLSDLFPGKITMVDTVDDLLEDADLVFADMNDLPLGLFEELHERHARVVAFSPSMNVLEDDREFAKFLASKSGFAVPSNGTAFSQIAGAREWITQIDSRDVVLKGNDNCVILSKKDALNLLDNEEALKSFWNKGELFVESFIEGGTEMAYGGFFDGDNWLDVVFCTQEYKGAAEHNMGRVLTGEVGTCFKAIDREDLPQPVRVLQDRLTPALRSSMYRGFLDINTIFRDSVLYFLEFTTRPGYPTELEIAGTHRLHGESYALFLMRLAGEKNGQEFFFPLKAGIATALYAQGLGLAYPKAFSGFNPIIEGIDDSMMVLPFDARWVKTEDGVEWRASDWDRAVFVMSSLEPDCADTLASHHQAVSKLSCWGHTHRKDIGDKWNGTIDNTNTVVHYVDRPNDVRVGLWSADVNDILLQRLAFIEYSCFDADEVWEDDNFQEYFDLPRESRLAVSAVENGMVVGYALFNITQTDDWELSNLALLPAYRGNSHARDMLSLGVNNLRGCTRRIVAQAHHEGLIPWYESLGFVVENSDSDGFELSLDLQSLDA